MWVDAFGVEVISDNDHGEEVVGELVGEWQRNVEGLMNWLDWPVWIKCRPACNEDSICYFPMWPFGLPKTEEPVGSALRDATPRCITKTMLRA